MFNRCEHQWKIITRRFTAPPGHFKGKAASQDHMNDIMFGFTTIEQECELCHKVDFVKVAGDQR